MQELKSILLNQKGAMDSAKFPDAYEYIYTELKNIKQ